MRNVAKQKVTRQEVATVTPKLASFDLGNGFVKTCGSNGIKTYAAVIGDLNETLDGFSGLNLNHEEDFIIGYNGKRVVIGNGVYRKGLGAAQVIRHTSRIETPFYKTLFASALFSAVPGNTEAPTTVEVVLSLPPSAYYERDKQKENLAGVYEIEIPADRGTSKTYVYEVPYNLMRVIPEGVGTVCRTVLDEQGCEIIGTDLHTKVIGVVDVGTLTTDLIMLDSLRLVRRGCDSVPHALNDIYQKIIKFASRHSVMIEEYRADDIAGQGYFLRQGERISIEREYEKWSGELATSVDAAIRTIWNGGDDVETILLRGGGAPAVYPYLQSVFPHVRLASDNKSELVTSNAEGGYRYGLLRRRENE